MDSEAQKRCVPKGPPLGLRQFMATEALSEQWKMLLVSPEKALFVLTPDILGGEGKRLDKKAKINL